MKHSKACRHYVEPAKTPTRKKKTKEALISDGILNRDSGLFAEPKDEE